MTPVTLVPVVEDEQLVRDTLDEALTEGGFTVSTAATADEAMVMLDQESTHYRAMITDVNLSGELTGWDVARHARETRRTLPIVYITGGSAHDWASQGVPNSILLTKPFGIAKMITAVSQLLNAAPGAG